MRLLISISYHSTKKFTEAPKFCIAFLYSPIMGFRGLYGIRGTLELTNYEIRCSLREAILILAISKQTVILHTTDEGAAQKCTIKGGE